MFVGNAGAYRPSEASFRAQVQGGLLALPTNFRLIRLSVIMLSNIMQSVIMLSVIMLSVIMLSVIMLSVVVG